MTPADTSPEPEGSTQPGPLRSTHFDFQARVFQAPGAHFALKGRNKEAMFAVEMGTGQAYVSLKNLRKTFFISKGSHDDQLLDRAADGLKYVPDIRPGDEIPNEVLNGTASWTVAKRHKQIARDRIQVQLLSWVNGKPVSYGGKEDLKKIVSSDENKRALVDAFKRAALAMGLKENESEKVVDHIETLARELCYVEALRERCFEVRRIRKNVVGLVKVYNDDMRTSADIGRIKTLLGKGLRELDDILNSVDAESADILGALMSIDKVVQSVRKARDDLHYILMEWDPIIAQWKDLQLVRSQEIDRALSATYKLLATRFETGRSIVSKRKPGPAPDSAKNAGSPDDKK
jgi:hypothetical protein